MVTSGFEVVYIGMRVEWKSATIIHGKLCVMTPGVHLMQEWYADSLNFHQQVLQMQPHVHAGLGNCEVGLLKLNL